MIVICSLRPMVVIYNLGPIVVIYFLRPVVIVYTLIMSGLWSWMFFSTHELLRYFDAEFVASR